MSIIRLVGEGARSKAVQQQRSYKATSPAIDDVTRHRGHLGFLDKKLMKVGKGGACCTKVLRPNMLGGTFFACKIQLIIFEFGHQDAKCKLK